MKNVEGHVNFEKRQMRMIKAVPIVNGSGTTPFYLSESARLFADSVRMQNVPLDSKLVGHRSTQVLE